MAGARLEHPYYPIIYVRGYAGTDSDIEDTVSDPYMGFNLGSTRIRTLWTGDTERYYFESPLVRLMKDFEYGDVYSAGLNITEIDKVPPGTIEPRSITIYRYYDQVSSVFGAGKQVTMEDFGRGLSDLIIKLRDRICADDDAEKAGFKVYLVGHSMGGLVIRCFLQNDAIGDPIARKCVDKVFTYATPHNGIEMEIIGNVPAFFTSAKRGQFQPDAHVQLSRASCRNRKGQHTERQVRCGSVFLPDRHQPQGLHRRRRLVGPARRSVQRWAGPHRQRDSVRW